MTRQLVLRRPIAAVGGDANRLTNGLAKSLEQSSGQPHGTWYVPREEAERRRLADIGVNELPHVEVRREFLRERRVPRFDLVKVARQLACSAFTVAQHAARHQRVTLRLVEPVSVDDTHRVGAQLRHQASAPPYASARTRR